MMAISPNPFPPLEACPCDSQLSYAACCSPFHHNLDMPPTAPALMRSRYSAYALGHVDYIIQTTHRDNPQYQRNIPAWRRELQTYCQNTTFQKLEILAENSQHTTATVTFRATLLQAGQPLVFSEKSTFLKIGRRWLYHSGQISLE